MCSLQFQEPIAGLRLRSVDCYFKSPEKRPIEHDMRMNEIPNRFRKMGKHGVGRSQGNSNLAVVPKSASALFRRDTGPEGDHELLDDYAANQEHRVLGFDEAA
jgi:hypothetical protein